jgi:hypothetical protein
MGILFTVFIIFAVLHSVFGSWLIWVISGFVLIMWIAAITSGGFFAKILWSLALFFTTIAVWEHTGCPGNGDYCVQLEAERVARDKVEVIERAEERMASCAASLNWRDDADCKIYTAQEIADAKAKHDAEKAAREAEESAKQDAERKAAEAERRARLVKERDSARKARGSVH